MTFPLLRILKAPLSERAFEIRYRKELDGLRCVAVVMVLIFHGAKPWLRGGWVGVDIFFVLSGFLITTLLMWEFRQLGRISLKWFYARRVARLFPALYSMLLAAFVFSFFLPEAHRTTLRGEIIAAGLHVWNYGETLGFWQPGSTTWIYHTWSLSTEEQFYFVWPCLLSFVLMSRMRLWSSLLLTTVLYFAFSGYATILVGCMLAMVFPASLPRRASSWLGTVMVASTTFIGYVALTSPPINPSLRATIALASSVIIVFLMHNPDQRATRLLGHPIPVFIGKLSYGLYLWHILVFKVLYLAWGTVPSSYHQVVFVIKILASFLVATLSYYLIESPFLRLKKTFSPVKTAVQGGVGGPCETVEP